MKSGYSITGRLDYSQENVTVGVACLSDPACLCYRMHTGTRGKCFCVSYLFNVQKTARCIVKIKTSNR